MIDPTKRILVKGVALGVLSAMSGCVEAKKMSRSVSTVKFNYTDRYIGDVVVDGAWTGGVDAYSGGGKMAEGLLAPSDPNRKVVLKVKWSVGSYYSIPDDSYTRAPIEEKTAEVEVARPYPSNPDYLVLHFYPDGHVEAELEADRPKRRVPPPPGYHR